jgi:hypothetical protein
MLKPLVYMKLDCEAKKAKFLGTPDSILYSYGISTIFSVIPAFCKKGDIIVTQVHCVHQQKYMNYALKHISLLLSV